MIVEINREEALNIIAPGDGTELDEAERLLNLGNKYFYCESEKIIYVLPNDCW